MVVPSGKILVPSARILVPARPATSISFREQLNAIKWDDKERDRKARRSRREYSNRDFVDKQQLPLLFEAMTLGMMVHTPEDPVEVRCCAARPSPMHFSFLRAQFQWEKKSQEHRSFKMEWRVRAHVCAPVSAQCCKDACAPFDFNVGQIHKQFLCITLFLTNNTPPPTFFHITTTRTTPPIMRSLPIAQPPLPTFLNCLIVPIQ